MKNSLGVALFVSLGLHIAILIGIPANILNAPKNKLFLPAPETKFIDTARLPPERKAPQSKPRIIEEPPQYVSFKDKTLNLAKQTKKALSEALLPRKLAEIKEVTFLKTAEKLDDLPAYVNYYEEIREKIRTKAYSYYNSLVSGKIFLTFTVDDSGKLGYVGIDRSKSSESPYLKKISTQSVQNSAPFPEFPPDLKKFKTLTFNLSVHFKNQ